MEGNGKSNLHEILATNIRRIMEAKDINAGDIYKKTDLHLVTVSELRNGKATNPRLNTLAALAEGLEIDVTDLLVDRGIQRGEETNSQQLWRLFSHNLFVLGSKVRDLKLHTRFYHFAKFALPELSDDDIELCWRDRDKYGKI